MLNNLIFRSIKPEKPLNDFVESFWILDNPTDKDIESIGLPDGRIDLFLIKSGTAPFRVVLLGLGTQRYEEGIIPANSLRFAISFKLLAVEYILQQPIADIINYGRPLPQNFWDFEADDLKDFHAFCKKATQKITTLLPATIDKRKQKLFDAIYTSNGERTVKALSEIASWSSRQINRYFNQQFGLSLKAYCNILRFRASLEHIAKGKLFPELNFTDQTHFIKAVKKFSGVSPKELSKNKNDRFVLLAALKQQ